MISTERPDVRVGDTVEPGGPVDPVPSGPVDGGAVSALDDCVGFSCADHLSGRAVDRGVPATAEPDPDIAAEPEPEPIVDEPVVETPPEPAPDEAPSSIVPIEAPDDPIADLVAAEDRATDPDPAEEAEVLEPQAEPVAVTADRPAGSTAPALPSFLTLTPAFSDAAWVARKRPVISTAPVLDDAYGRMALAIYILLLGTVVSFGVSGVLAGWLARSNRYGAPDWLRSHFTYGLRTVVAAAVAGALGLVLVAVSVGVFVLTAAAIWLVLRAATGLMRLMRAEPIKDPLAWSLA